LRLVGSAARFGCTVRLHGSAARFGCTVRLHGSAARFGCTVRLHLAAFLRHTGCVPIFRLDERVVFPPPELADSSGLLAVEGDLRPERLLLAYSMGIFPWPCEGFPLLWHSPDPRFVLKLDLLHVPRRLAKLMRKRPYAITLDQGFRRVIEACAKMPRPRQDGTWIDQAMVEAYCELHRLGFAHSVEAWLDGELVGGLYGVSLGAAFFGESMFATQPDASKIGFVTMLRQLERWRINLIDAQVHTDHLERFGAEHVPRKRYLALLAQALKQPTRRGSWQLDEDL
jgi:leucyl/phenylalanyl-tRNA---protein transferase